MSRKTFNISLALRLTERYDHRCAIGIIRYARQKENWRLLGNESLFFTALGQSYHVPDGIIARITSRQELEQLKAYKVPLIDIAGSYHDPELYQTVNDDLETGAMAARHFLARGFSNYAYVGINDMIWSERRQAGFVGEVERALGIGVSSFTLGVSWLRRDYNLSRLIRWLKKLPVPCAVMAANDLVGYRIGIAATMAGLSMPGQLAIIGVDNEDVFCELAEPKLSSIACDCEAIGSEAAALLDKVLADRNHSRNIVVTPGMVEARESTDIVISEDSLVREVKNYIRTNIRKGINVADVARQFPLSRRTLERRFRSVEGRSIHDAILDIRLQKARHFLAAGRTATQAGYESGFVSIQHFHHTFKKNFRLTPNEYAASVRRDKLVSGGRYFDNRLE